MTQEESIEYLKGEGFDLFHIEERPKTIIICGCRNEPRGCWYKLEDGKLFRRSGYNDLERKWGEEKEINEKLNRVREKESGK